MPVSKELRKQLILAYKMKPVRGLSYLKKRGGDLVETWDYDELASKMHSKSFTAAKTTGSNVLQDIFDEVVKAKENGTPVKEFIDNLRPKLEEKGWWGKKVVDGKTVTLGTPSRLKTILDTNIKTSHAAGRYESMQNISKYRPWWVYEQIHRSTRREEHKVFDKKIFHHSNSIVNKIFPPRGFGCDCSMRAISDEEMKRLVKKGYKLVDKNELDDEVTKEQKEFDPIGDYEPEVRDYEPQIKQALKEALERYNKEQQEKQKKIIRSQVNQVNSELEKVKSALKKIRDSKAPANTKNKLLKQLNTAVDLIGAKINKLKKAVGKSDIKELKKAAVSYAALMITMKKLRT